MIDKQKSRTKSIYAAMALGKSTIEEPIDNTKGFTASPDLIIDLINQIAIPISEDLSEFGKIVLNFDAKRREIWWTNETRGGLFFVNFGYATYDYFNECWGDGQIGINADKLSKYLKMYKKEKEITFCADMISKKYSIYNEKVNASGNLETITEIPTAKPRIDVQEKSENRIKLYENYIPIMEKEDRMLKYGAETYNLNRITHKGKRDTYPLCIMAKSPGLWVGNRRQEFDLGIIDGSFLPPEEEIHLLIDKKIEALAKNLKGKAITLRVAKGEKTPFNPKTSLYLLRKDQGGENPNGMLKSGFLLCVDNVKTESDGMMEMF